LASEGVSGTTVRPAAQLSVKGGACIFSVTTADCSESREYTEVNFDVIITKNN